MSVGAPVQPVDNERSKNDEQGADNEGRHDGKEG
jgi:hypothetical protein